MLIANFNVWFLIYMYFNYYNLNLRKSILSQLQYCNIKLKINYKTDLKLILETNIWY